jgi:hypothetical protein
MWNPAYLLRVLMGDEVMREVNFVCGTCACLAVVVLLLVVLGPILQFGNALPFHLGWIILGSVPLVLIALLLYVRYRILRLCFGDGRSRPAHETDQDLSPA